MPLTLSLRRPFRRHTLPEVPELSARGGGGSFVRDRRSTPPQAGPRAEPVSVYPRCLPLLSERSFRAGLNSGGSLVFTAVRTAFGSIWPTGRVTLSDHNNSRCVP